VEKNKLLAIRIRRQICLEGSQRDGALGSSCDNLRLDEPVDFYIAEHRRDPTVSGRARSFGLK